MKIVASVNETTLLVQMTKDEIAELLGYRDKYTMEQRMSSAEVANLWRPDIQYQFGQRWTHLETIGKLPRELVEAHAKVKRIEELLSAAVAATSTPAFKKAEEENSARKR